MHHAADRVTCESPVIVERVFTDIEYVFMHDLDSMPTFPCLRMVTIRSYALKHSQEDTLS